VRALLASSLAERVIRLFTFNEDSFVLAVYLDNSIRRALIMFKFEEDSLENEKKSYFRVDVLLKTLSGLFLCDIIFEINGFFGGS
jgi:hypothetical protein